MERLPVKFVAMPVPEQKLWCDLIPKPVVTKLWLWSHCTVTVNNLQVIHKTIPPL